MIRTAATFLVQLLGAVTNYSVGLFYTQWTHRYLLYLAFFVLSGILTYGALEIYGWITWRVSSVSFLGNHILHTMINFGFCLYVADEWLARLTGRWGQFANRTLGKQALIWWLSFVAAFYAQRTIVYEGIQYYALDLYHHFEEFPQLRPRPLEHFLFCLPFFIGTLLLLWLMTFVRQRGLIQEQQALDSKEQALVAREEAQREKVSIKELDRNLAPLCFQSGSSQIIVDQASISHVSVEDHYCHIHTVREDADNSYFIKSSLKDLLEKLSEDHFIQIHRSHVVNVQAIRQLDKKNRACKVWLKSDAVLPVSRHRLNEVVERLNKTLEMQNNANQAITDNR